MCKFVNIECKTILFDYNKSHHGANVVMLVEIPNFEVILGVIVAFLLGVGGVYLYYIISTHFKSKNGDGNGGYSDRFKYYEKQLIDMKIRLDSLDLQGAESKLPKPIQTHMRAQDGLGHKSVVLEDHGRQQPRIQSAQNNAPEPAGQHTNSTEYVLHLITNNPMTSRDIQTMLKKSREHTSRLMKKLYVDGYVKRNTESKPYTYSITEKGVARLKT